MYKRNERGFFKHLDFILLDSLMVQVSFALSYLLRYGLSNPYGKEEYCQMACIYGVLFVFVSFFMESYKNIIHRGYYAELKQTLKNQSVVTLVLVMYLFATKSGGEYSRYIIVMSWAIEVYLIYMEHIIWKSVLIQKLKKNSNERKVVLVVSGIKEAKEVLQEYKKLILDFHIVGIILPESERGKETIANMRSFYGMEEGLAYISEYVVDEVMIHVDADHSIPDSFIEDCLNMGVIVHQKLCECVPADAKKEVTRIGNFILLTACINSVTSRQFFLKRFIDIVGALIGLLFTGIAYIIVAPVIRIQSPGPVFFKQKRVGKNGRQFYIYKFRSMYMDAEERKAELMEQNKMKGPIAKFDNDPRIFPFGKLIRKWSIDELPQFWNVLKGDMSLVGTRPPTVDEYEKYELHHKKRLATRPGLTGMWQVSGRSDIEDFEEIVQLDSAYIAGWHLSLDIKILFQTVLAVLRQKGAE